MDNNPRTATRFPVEEPTPVHLDDAVGWSAVEELLEESLRGINAQDPAHYITTMMPSRQAARASWGYSIPHRMHTHPGGGGIGGRRHASSAGRRPVRPTVRLRARADCRDSPSFDLIQDVVDDLIIEEDEEPDDDDEGPDEAKILASIKSITAPMAVKRSERDRLVKSKKRDLGSSLVWKTMSQKNWNHIVEKARSVFKVGFIWHNAIRNIEGHYGTSVAAVFVFVQWLFLVNVLVLFVVAILIVLPQAVHGATHYRNSTVTLKNESLLEIAASCSTGKDAEYDGIGLLQDFIQGTGWMAWTEMFYGYYQYDHIGIFVDSDGGFVYNLPIAYIVATVTYFGLCLVLMLRNTAKGSRENLFTLKGRVNECCNIVFGGWDYCISEEKKAGLRHEIIYNEIKVIIEEDKLLELKKSRTEKDRIILYSLRILINSFVICLLLLCGYLIYFVVYKSRQLLSQRMQSPSSGDFVTLSIEFLPSMVITALNIFVPFAFYRLVTFERYSPGFVINITLVRTVFLKMASIAVLITTLYNGVINGDDFTQNQQCITCWETYVGQQIYKLAVMDFATGLFITFVIHFPRMLIVTRGPQKFTKFIGRQQFDIPNNVLDIVYSQTLCWMGTFYSPLLPVLNVLKCFIFFYVKQFSLFINCEPSRVTYRASKSNTLFTIVLLLSFILAIVPVAYSVGEITPSKFCGPFMGLHNMWAVVPKMMSTWPVAAQHFVRYFGTAGFAIPAIIVLILIIYFYITMSSAHKHEIHLLQEQLLMEGRDKQYLLNRLRHVLAYRQSYIAAS